MDILASYFGGLRSHIAGQPEADTDNRHQATKSASCFRKCLAGTVDTEEDRGKARLMTKRGARSKSVAAWSRKLLD